MLTKNRFIFSSVLNSLNQSDEAGRQNPKGQSKTFKAQSSTKKRSRKIRITGNIHNHNKFMKRTFSRCLIIRDTKEGGLFGLALSCLYAFSHRFEVLFLPYFSSFFTRQISQVCSPSGIDYPHGHPLHIITGSHNDGLTNPVSLTGSRRLTPYIYMHECDFRTKGKSQLVQLRSRTPRAHRLTSLVSLLSSQRITL